MTPPSSFTNSILHLIWIGNKLRDEELNTARELLTAAYVNRTKVHFYVDNASQHSVHALLTGTLQSKKLKQNNIDPGFDFLKNGAAQVINIDTDLEPYIQKLLILPGVKAAIENFFVGYPVDRIAQFILLIIKFERIGAGKNLAAASDILRAIALIGQGGHYADLDIILKRALKTFEFLGKIIPPNHLKVNLFGKEFRSSNNDILAAPVDDPSYVELLAHYIKKYACYIAADYLFLEKKLQPHKYTREKINPFNKLLHYISKNYISAFSRKRLDDRFIATHRITGNFPLADVMLHYQLFNKEHSFEGTLFGQAQSASPISWRGKSIALNDESYAYHVSNAAFTKEFNLIPTVLRFNFDSTEYIRFYVKHLMFERQTDIILDLHKLDHILIDEIISQHLIDSPARFVACIPAFFKHLEDGQGGLMAQEGLNLLHMLQSIKRTHEKTMMPILNENAQGVMYAYLSFIHDCRKDLSVAEQPHFDEYAGNELKEYLTWCDANFEEQIKKNVSWSRN